mmetsp:Transcript_11206/g.17148  ORF Transcript_11206/g.17148 Transcript_11206/m.17148 type:complete len:464 (+) Transcript_11206:64-1455(+)
MCITNINTPPNTNNTITQFLHENATHGDVIYLTGATGFIGQIILKECDNDPSISKVYCPVRNKKGATGEERFISTGLSNFKKTAYVPTTGNILPNDVTMVILNAYEVKFFNPVDHILKNNVVAMLQILDQCVAAGPRIKGVSVVSTAYVQEPLPYRRREGNRISFVLREFTSASEVYEDLVNDRVSWEELREKYSDTISSYHQMNCYAFSKHIMEHTIHERYPNLPLCVVRPSIVAPTRDGVYGHGQKTGFPLFMEIARSPILRFPKNEGQLNLIFVEEVARDIVKGATEYAKAASLDENNELFHPIRSSTSSADITSIPLLDLSYGGVMRFDLGQNEKLRTFLRKLEKAVIGLLAGQKKSKLVDLVYSNFDPFMGNNWDFEKVHPVTLEDMESMGKGYYECELKLKALKKTQKSTDGSMSWQWMLLAMVVALFAFLFTFYNASPLPTGGLIVRGNYSDGFYL